jgi:hypothetical protein
LHNLLGTSSQQKKKKKISSNGLKTYHTLVLNKDLVVGRNGNKENDGSDILEAVNPLLALGPLTSHVEHPVHQLPNLELGLRDTRGLHTRSENILVVGDILRVRDPIYRVKVAEVKGKKKKSKEVVTGGGGERRGRRRGD